MSTQHLDFEKFYREAPALVRSKNYSRAQLLQLLQEEIQSCKQLWDEYRQHQDANRSHATAEDIAEAEQAYKRYHDDTAEAHSDDEIIDSFVHIKATGMVMQSIIERGKKGGPLARKQAAVVKQGRGCLIFAALLIPAAAGLTAWII